MKILVIIAVTFAVMLCPVLTVAGDLIFIGNPSITASTLTKDDISKIFFGKKIEWKDKSKIIIAFQKNPAIHNLFLKKYIHQSPSRFANFWKRQIFTGKVSTLNRFNSDEEVVKFISETKGSIGYVSPDAKLDNVKTIGVD